MDFITQPFFLLLTWLNNLTGNFGWSIILLTVIIRGALLPLTLPALKTQKKMRSLQPELTKLKEKYKDDKSALTQAQMSLYKEYDVNPLAGCLPYLVQFGILIALYSVLRQVIGGDAGDAFSNLTFLGVNLAQRDGTYLLPIMAAVLQFILSLMILPGTEHHDIVPDESKSKIDRELNKKEDDLQEMGAMMQKQMMFVLPVFTGVMAASFPAGIALYWVVTTLFSLVQQLFVSGPGGLTKYVPTFIKDYLERNSFTLNLNAGKNDKIAQQEVDFAAAVKKSSASKKTKSKAGKKKKANKKNKSKKK